jgi:hypothetical protein
MSVVALSHVLIWPRAVDMDVFIDHLTTVSRKTSFLKYNNYQFPFHLIALSYYEH